MRPNRLYEIAVLKDERTKETTTLPERRCGDCDRFSKPELCGDCREMAKMNFVASPVKFPRRF